MKIYKIGNKKVLVQDNIPYVEAESDDEVSEADIETALAPEVQKRGRKSKVPPEIKQAAIDAVINEEATMDEAAKQYHVNVHSLKTWVYQKKSGRKSSAQINTERPERIEYECADKHRFKTNLAFGQAKCPECGTRNVHFYKEPEIKEE